MKTILAPLDFSGVSDAVVAEAAALARAVHGRVVLYAVVQPPIITSEYAPLMENYTELLAAGEAAAARNLEHAAERLRCDGLSVETAQSDGAPAPEILAQAQECAADYIVMGSHGHTALYDLVVGSTTHGVVQHAPCPVVIVPPPQKPARRPMLAGVPRSKRRARTKTAVL
jgi:nucleotide-binding universal stress UspA family protein